MNAWISLIIAGACEVGFTICLKYSENLSRNWWTVGFFVFISLSFHFLNEATKQIPIGTAYAVWTGIGATGTVIAGILLFHEPLQTARILFLILLIGSIIGLKVVS